MLHRASTLFSSKLPQMGLKSTSTLSGLFGGANNSGGHGWQCACARCKGTPSLDERGRGLATASGGDNKFLAAIAAGPVTCAEGYLFEMERRGYVSIGAFVPTVVLDHPEAVKQLHREFLRAGSDIIEAFTYYAHREKMRLVGKEHLIEDLNKTALRLAREVADEDPTGGAMVAGNICNTTLYTTDDDEETRAEIRAMFAEQVGWAADAGVDLIIGETFTNSGEGLLALEAIQPTGLPAVITFAVQADGLMRDGMSVADACRLVGDAGAAVVGINCSRGPDTMLPILEDLSREVGLPPIAALPVAYNTTPDKPTMQSLSDINHKYCDLDSHVCTRYDIAEFTTKAMALGVTYYGICCGNAPHHMRAMSQALGRIPAASENDPDLSKHFVFGTKEGLGQTGKKEGTVDGNLNWRDAM